MAGAVRRSPADGIEPARGRPPRRGGALASAGRPGCARRSQQRQPGGRRGARIRSATRPPRSRRACAPRPRAPSPRCPCRSACSNISPPIGWRFRRRCLPRPASMPGNGAACLPAPTKRRAGSSKPFIPRLPAARPMRLPRRWLSGPSRNRRSSRGPPGHHRPRPPPAPALRLAMSSHGSNAAAAAASNRPDRASPRHRLERPALFRWECGPSGDIAWVDGAPRGALIGRSIAIARNQADDGVDEDVARAFALRAPFRDALLSLPGDGLASGEWKISGVPAFEPADGRFAGYRGVAMRDLPPPSAQPSVASEILTDPDSLRELVHEIKTPLNAIIGFAEIIDGQYLGPADRRYRERAARDRRPGAAAAGRDRRSGFRREDPFSDRAARPPGGPCGTARIARGVAARARREARRRARDRARTEDVAVRDRARARRPLALPAVPRAGRAFGQRASGCGCRSSRRVIIAAFRSAGRPALRSVGDEQLFDPRPVAAGEDLALGIGFALRLVRGLARIAGGDLVTSPAGITLLVPRA